MPITKHSTDGFNGSCDTVLFNQWAENFLIKELGPGQFIFMDNTAFHKLQKTKELIESVGCKIIFLPPYSHELNPIEKFWANMNGGLEKKLIKYKTYFTYYKFSSPHLIQVKLL